MRNANRARAALERAEREASEIDRSLWLAKAADHAVKGQAVLVGGAAVNLYTGSYRPTDIDMCAYLDAADRRMLQELGFQHLQDDHFSYQFGDGERWLIEFPSSQVDGDVSLVALDHDETLTVIALESLIVDRVLRATDQTSVTFEEAVRLCVAVFEEADWNRVEDQISQRDHLEPRLRLRSVYSRVVAETRALLGG